MKKNPVLILTISSALLATGYSQFSHAQVNWSCRKAYANNAIEKAKPFIALGHLRPVEVRNIESSISILENKIKDQNFKLASLTREANGDFSIPYFSKPDILKETEKKLSSEKFDIQDEHRELAKVKSDLNSAKNSLDPKTAKNEEADDTPGFLMAFKMFGIKTEKKKWTQEDVDRLEKRVAFLEENIKIRTYNVDVYTKKIATIEAPLKEEGIKKAKHELGTMAEKEEKLKNEIVELQAKKAKLQEQLRAEAMVTMKKALSDNRLTTPINDLMGFYSLKNMSSTNKVTLLVGNKLNSNDRVEYNQAMQVKELVENLVKKQFYVIFDGESTYAPYISQIAGDFGIPVMSRAQQKFADHKNKVLISNDFLRMQILAESQAVIATPDSVTGMGLYTEGLLTNVLDTKGGFETGSLNAWTKDLDKRDRNLGVTSKSVNIVNKAQQLFAKPEIESSFASKSINKPVEKFKKYLKYSTENLSTDGLERILKEAISFAKVMEQNQQTGGSVIFGSSKEDKHSANLIYQSAYKLGQLGIAVVTGGSGGAMEIANSGAWNSGGVSVGIPIGGKHTLDTEKDFASSKHTKTIITSGYEERIPALLGEGVDSRKLIIFAPGGNGTIKEFATTLVRASGKFSSFQKIVFLDSDYYGPFVNWLKSSSLPQSLKDKIVLVDKVEELENIALQMQENFERERMQKPRKDQLTYEVKTFPSFKSENSVSEGRWSARSSTTTTSQSDTGNKKNKEKIKNQNKNQNKNSSNYSESKKNTNAENQGKNGLPTKFKDSAEEEEFYRNVYGKFYE